MNRDFKVITISGTPYERGYQYGYKLSKQIRSFLDDNVARINLVRKENLTLEEALLMVDSYIPFIEEYIPKIAEEILGLASGANITYREAMLLQLRRELISKGLECSSLAFCDPNGKNIIAQNIDLPGNLTDLGVILKVKGSSPDEPSILMYTHVGLLGYLGLNSYGIGIGLNMVLSPGWTEGVPPYLLIRHLLHQKKLEDCLLEIRRIKRASSRNLLLCDKERIIDVEMTVDQETVIEEPFIIHTNHYLDEQFSKVDQINANASTFTRLNRLEQLLASYKNKPSIKQIEHLLKDHDNYPKSICAHGQGDYSRGETIASVILKPENGVMFAAKGNPCKNSFKEFSLFNE